MGVPGSSGSSCSSPRIPQTEDRLSQRFSQLVTKSGSESDLSKNTETRRRSSYAGYITNAFLNSESCDNIHLEPSQNVDMQRLLVIWQKMSDHASKIISGILIYLLQHIDRQNFFIKSGPVMSDPLIFLCNHSYVHKVNEVHFNIYRSPSI